MSDTFLKFGSLVRNLVAWYRIPTAICCIASGVLIEYFALSLDAISDTSWKISKVVSPSEDNRMARYFSARVSSPVLRGWTSTSNSVMVEVIASISPEAISANTGRIIFRYFTWCSIK
jgi:hypothetical protein